MAGEHSAPAILPFLTRPQAGQATIVGPRTNIERETIACAHCSVNWYSRGTDGTRDLGGWCRICTSPVCGKCADLGVCDPFEKKLERWEAAGKIAGAVDRQVARARLFREMGI